MKLSLNSLPLQLFAFLALPLLFLLTLLAFGSAALHQIAMRDLVASQDVYAIRGAAEGLSERLEQQHTILAVLGEGLNHGSSPQETIESLGYLPEVIFDGGMAFYDDQGNLLAVSPESGTWRSEPFLMNALSHLDLDHDVAYIPLVTPGQNKTQIVIVTPVPPEMAGFSTGSVYAVGAVSLDALGLSALIDSLHTPGAAVYIADQDGQIIYHSDPAQVGTQLPDTLHARAAMRGESGANYGNTRENGKIVSTFAPVPSARWTLIQEQHWVETISPLMRYSQSAPLILLPGFLVAAGAVWFGLRRIVQPLQKLRDRASDLAWGDFASIEIPVGGVGEIRQLQETLQEMAKRLQATQADMHHYIAAITQAQEDERVRLARELHDQPVQSLIALDHRMQRLKRHLESDPQGARILQELREMTAQSIDDLRRIIRAMRPVYLDDLGLVPALQTLVQSTNEDGPVKARFSVEGTARRLSPEQEITLYRVAQEALTNARRHGQAENITLRVRFEDDAVLLSVEDDGCGFAVPRRPAELSSQGHFGLVGMHERATLIGAHLHIQSGPDQGTKVWLKTPL